jgi:hypothetical protein
MPDLPDELIRINAVLHEYIAIHDAIFKFAWRKAIPIPGLFKPTDFGAHVKDLSRLASKLTAISSALKADSGTLEGTQPFGISAEGSTKKAKVISANIRWQSTTPTSKSMKASSINAKSSALRLISGCTRIASRLRVKWVHGGVPIGALNVLEVRESHHVCCRYN